MLNCERELCDHYIANLLIFLFSFFLFIIITFIVFNKSVSKRIRE